MASNLSSDALNTTNDRRTDADSEAMWTQQILFDVATAVDLIYKQQRAEHALEQTSMAIRRGVTFGIETPDIDFHQILMNTFHTPDPKKKANFFVASEMGALRRDLGKENMISINNCKVHAARMSSLSTAADIRVNKLITDIRMLSNIHYRRRNQLTIDAATAMTEMDNKIKHLYSTFLLEVATLDNNIILDSDAANAITPKKAPNVVLHRIPPVPIAPSSSHSSHSSQASSQSSQQSQSSSNNNQQPVNTTPSTYTPPTISPDTPDTPAAKRKLSEKEANILSTISDDDLKKFMCNRSTEVPLVRSNN